MIVRKLEIPHRHFAVFTFRLKYLIACRVVLAKLSGIQIILEAGQALKFPCLQALRRNPFAPGVPCHRVVAGNLELGGFDGDWVSSASCMDTIPPCEEYHRWLACSAV